MSMTKGQARAFGKGTLATIDREKEKQSLVFKVEYPPHIRGDQITDAVRYALFVRGGLDQATSHVEVARSLPDYRQLLTEKEEALKLEKARNAQMAEELERLKAMIAEQQPDTREWITMQDLADQLKLHHSTVWRAFKKGRLTAKPKGGGCKKTHYICDPTTYVPAIRKLTKE
jgi:hypothetical protein